jgi:hypothetical protein
MKLRRWLGGIGAGLFTVAFIGGGWWFEQHPHYPGDWARDECHDEIRAQIPEGADFSGDKIAHTTGITYVVTGTYRTRGPYPLSFPYSCTANATDDGFTVVTGIDGLGR